MTNRECFFIDWCPVDTPILATLTDSKIDAKRSEHLKNICNYFSKKGLADIYFSYRRDGFFMFWILVDETASKDYDFFELARSIATFIKSRCLGHEHVHHDTEWSMLSAHYPVSFMVPDPNVDFLSLENGQRGTIFNTWLLEDEVLRKLYANDRSDCATEELALPKLLDFFGSKYGDCAEYVSQFRGHHLPYLRKQMFIPMIGITGFAFIVSAIMVYSRTANEHLSAFIVAGAVALLVYAAADFLIQFRRGVFPVLKHVDSTIGYLSRAVSLARVMDRLFQNSTPDTMRLVNPSFEGAVESLRVISRQVESDIEAKRFFLIMAITLMAAAFAFVAIK